MDVYISIKSLSCLFGYNDQGDRRPPSNLLEATCSLTSSTIQQLLSGVANNEATNSRSRKKRKNENAR